MKEKIELKCTESPKDAQIVVIVRDDEIAFLGYDGDMSTCVYLSYSKAAELMAMLSKYVPY